MKNLKLTCAIIALSATPLTANAQGFLDSINNVVNKVDQTISSGERAQSSINRVMDKIPESEQQAEPAPQAAPAPSTTTADEEAILKQAREIEERKILEAAEKIKQERAATAGNY